MTRKKHQERRLLVVSKRRQPSDEGLARLVAAMVLHQLDAKRRDDEQLLEEPTGRERRA